MDVKEIKLYRINNHYIAADCIYHAIQIWQDYAKRYGIDSVEVLSLTMEDECLLAENNKQYYAVNPMSDSQTKEELFHDAEEPVVDETERIEDAEKRLLTGALERNQGNRKAAAAELGISERTVYRKMKDYGL